MTACSGVPDAVPVAGPSYFGQTPPGPTPELFAPGVVNTEAIELNGVFSPDVGEFFFTRIVDGVGTMYHAVFDDERWSDPAPLLLYPAQARALAVDMAVSPDGQALYFLGRHPHADSGQEPGPDIWVSRRVDGAWATAEVVPAPVSSDAVEIYPVVVADGSLYFASDRAGSLGPSDLYRAQRLPDGGFAEPVNLGPPINGEGVAVGDPYVAPDERYIVFASVRPDGLGEGDLYVSFRQPDGAWGEPVNLGEAVNSAGHEYCPMVTPDGRYLFYSTRGETTGDIWWVDASILETLRPH